MPRKSKDELKEINNETNSNDVTVEVTVNKSTRSKTVKPADKGSFAIKTSKKSNPDVKGTLKVSKKGTSKSLTTTTKKKVGKVENTEKANKVPSKKSTSTRKSTKKTKAESDSKAIVSHVEYYDLPHRYNATTVKILAQTPTTLFIYWDISDNDRKSFTAKYGEDFFNNTMPVLVVTNRTMNYSFEIDINDFANCWYLHVNDANCDYSVELGRRPKYMNINIDNYIYVSTSNDMEMPNNHILFDRLGKTVFFRNVKNNFEEEKQISSISFIKSIGKIYDIYEIYQELYKDEINLEELDNMRLNLSSSGGSSSFM